MSFKLGTRSVIGPDGVYKAPSTSITGTGSTTGNAGGAALFSDGYQTYWAYPGDTTHIAGTGFQYRTILTHGYMMGGYKGGNAWRSVNKTWHANDTTFYCGEQLDRAASYQVATFSDYYGYVHGATGSNGGASTHTSSINLHNGTSRTRGRDQFGSASAPFGYGGNDAPASSGVSSAGQDNPVANTGVNTGIPYGAAGATESATVTGDTARLNDGVGGWETKVVTGNGAGVINQIGQIGYITAGSLAATDLTQKFHYGTEIMYTTTTSGLTGAGSCAHGQTKGYFSGAGTRKYITYSTDAYTAFTSACSPDGNTKCLSTKNGWHYWGTGTNDTNTQTKFLESTSADSTMANKLRTTGEDVFEMGQDWGYLIGAYSNGAQTNLTMKWTHATDAQAVMGSATRPKGHSGQSSGMAVSAAASITAAFRTN